MKITKARLKQIIMEELQREGDDRGEGSMADRQLNRIADLATMIDEMVDDDTKLEPWVESKITMAHSYLGAVLDHLKGEEADAREDEMGGEDEDDMEMYDDEDMLEEET